MKFASGSFVEAVVTVAAALLMTVAGFEMLQGPPSPAHGLAGAARPAAVAEPQRTGDATVHADLPHVAMPHVDSVRA